MTTRLHLISSLTKIPAPTPCQNTQRQYEHNHNQHITISNKISRRNTIYFLSLLYLTNSPAATAFSLGISGPKEWLREQKKKAAKYLLAPIYASRDSLRNASVLLKATTPELSRKSLAEELQKLLKSAARDCVVEDRNSFVAFQAQTGVEVCTFSLLVKNASSLLDKRNPIKLEAEANLVDLIRSFTFLNDALNNKDLQVASDRQKVEDMLMDTVLSLDKFEQGILKCLDA